MKLRDRTAGLLIQRCVGGGDPDLLLDLATFGGAILRDRVDAAEEVREAVGGFEFEDGGGGDEADDTAVVKEDGLYLPHAAAPVPRALRSSRCSPRCAVRKSTVVSRTESSESRRGRQ